MAGLVSSVAGTVALSCPLERKVVASAVLSQRTTEAGTKFEPATFIEKPAELTNTLTGVALTMDGELTVKLTALEDGCPGVSTATFAIPGEASSEFGTVVVS